MATKRAAPEDFQHSQPWKQRRPSYNDRPNHGKKSFKKAHPVNELKSTIRSIRRLLTRNDGLPATVRVEKERELQSAERELEAQHRAQRRSEMIGKWHKVRFFDRQKAERRLKKARRELREAEEGEMRAEDVKKLKKLAEEYETEVNYALYYPLEKDYVRLFQTAKKKVDDGADEQQPRGDSREIPVERQGDPGMWDVIKQCMKEGTLKDLREGRLLPAETTTQQDGESATEARKKPFKQAIQRQGTREKSSDISKSKQGTSDERSSDDDGLGFFE